MSNLFAALDLSDDENITVVKPAEPKGEKKHHVTKGEPKLQLPRKELQAQEEALKQQKKGPAGQRGSVPQPDVAHPGERSKSGVKKEQKPATHKQPEDGERRGRQFDRHSGTGRGREIKKGGGGGRNWGKPGDEQAPLPEGSPEPEAAAQTEAGAEPESTAPAVQEDPSLTFEEYERLRAAKRVGEAFQEKEARKVSTKIEGVAYKKDDNKGEGDYVVLGADEEHELKKKPGHFKHKQKEILEFDLKFRETTVEAPPRRGGREGGRGGSRSPRDGDRPERSERPDRPSGDRPPRGGGAPRGAGPRRGGAPGGGSARIDTADQSAFPKLGGSA